MKLEWVGRKCGKVWPEEPPADLLPGEGYKPGDEEQCFACDKPGCWAYVREAKARVPRSRGCKSKRKRGKVKS